MKKYNNMATDNKGIMVYLTPDLVDAIGQYCLDNGITRKIGGDEAAPSLGTGIAHYLKSTILNAVPLPDKNIVPNGRSNNNVGLSKEKITDLIEESNNNTRLDEERVLDLIKEYNNNSGLSEERVTDLIEEKITNLPSTLSLLDIDRLIGSAIDSVTKTNNEVITALKNILGHQGAEIDRLSKLVEKLSPTANSAANSTANSKPSQTPNSLSWGEFCELIGEPLPSERNKASGDKMTVVASNKGFSGWKYNGNSKKFTSG
jgi:hypothetical protein